MSSQSSEEITRYQIVRRLNVNATERVQSCVPNRRTDDDKQSLDKTSKVLKGERMEEMVQWHRSGNVSTQQIEREGGLRNKRSRTGEFSITSPLPIANGCSQCIECCGDSGKEDLAATQSDGAVEMDMEECLEICPEPGCDKRFIKCYELRKHEKTHSRVWKCSVPDCKYGRDGLPTEAELARHYNDKHATRPSLFECMFKPCRYKSKRESNCKQHMEIAHGWTYERTRGKRKTGNGNRGSG